MNRYEVLISKTYPGREFGVLVLDAKNCSHAENLARAFVMTFFCHREFYAWAKRVNI